MQVKIYGLGWVGKAMKTLFPDAWVHDPDLGYEAPNKADIAFVCVPTPLKEGKLDVSIVEDIIKYAPEDFFIIRSTVMPGTCDKLFIETGKKIIFQPEYLGETINHPMTDQKNRPFMVIGGFPEDRKKAIEVYQGAYNSNIIIRQVTAYEAEVIKLTENRAIAFKVAQCQELYDACQASGVDYYTIRDAVYGDDPRFNLWFSFVYPEARGFNSKCLPKDVYGWAAWAESYGFEPKLTKKMLGVNEDYIKPK